MNIIDITSAIKVLRPNAKFMVRGDTYEGIENWVDDGKPPPTKKEIESEIIRQQLDYDSKQYQRDRKYPELGEQLDLLFHDMTAGKGDKTGEWYKAVNKVKTDHPKPE